ncbi:MAG TPA: Uma2 family endonuclease [Caulobacteraceae bacterium]|jgi:Uma2 family endonuclease|nr:Uma2 family endonuclease [Caulobacteraceae bacterium]
MNAETQFATRRFTVDEVLAMQEAGIFGDFEKVELLNGELVPMQAKLDRHEAYKTALVRRLILGLPNDVDVLIEPTLYASAVSAPDPDIMVLNKGWKLREVKPADVRLVVEVADTSLAKDLGVKAAIYARFGVEDYWVIDAKAGRLIIHRGPEGETWREVRRLTGEEPATPLAFPSLSIRLRDLVARG